MMSNGPDNFAAAAGEPMQLDQQLTAALERKPEVRIAPDFAARVAAQAAVLPARKPLRIISYGQAAGVLCAILLLVTMFAIAPSTQPRFGSLSFDMELLVVAQLIALSWWLATRRRV